MASKEDLERFKQFIENYRRSKAIGAAGERWKEAQLRRYESYLKRGEVPPELLKVWHRKPKPVYKPAVGRLIPSARLKRDTAVVHGKLKVLQRVQHNLKPAKSVITSHEFKVQHNLKEQESQNRKKFDWKKVAFLAISAFIALKILKR